MAQAVGSGTTTSEPVPEKKAPAPPGVNELYVPFGCGAPSRNSAATVSVPTKLRSSNPAPDKFTVDVSARNAWEICSVPSRMVVLPVYVLSAESWTVPRPCFVKLPVPEMTDEISPLAPVGIDT
jgi:hypothetical protein